MERVNESEREFRHGDWGPKYLFRGPNIDWGIMIINSGQSLGAHYHNQVEETFYFLRGTPKMVINNEEYRVKVGDAFRIEPKEKHDIINDTEGPIRAIFLKFPNLPKDKVEV